mmetsp:Transcript_38178/g.85852  ORF Transcript_38178/g.85852 Transcript_38178/m.85852 type:complete len:536 (+) Transcript_38178:56-1663(+)
MTTRYNLRSRKTKTTGDESSVLQFVEEKKTEEPSPLRPTATDPPTTTKSQQDAAADYKSGTNWVHEGGIEANPYLFVLIVVSPFVSLLLAYATSSNMDSKLLTHPLTEMIPACLADIPSCVTNTLTAGSSVVPTLDGAKFVMCFMAVALFLERVLPGKVECGPETATGHVPQYVDNAVAHCFIYTVLFYLGSNLGPCGPGREQLLPQLSLEDLSICDKYTPYNFGIMYSLFPQSLSFLNIFGIVFCVFLMYKGLHFPSTEDNGSSGSLVKDYLWGTELYPRVFGLDLKRFINCRFSMTFWQLAGFSFCYQSYAMHGNKLDWGLFFSALSQYLYLVKFFFWEMGYMRSIDIIVDRAGYEIQWGCLVWVPAVYTFHTRFLVQNPSGLSFGVAFAIFLLSIAGVVLNYAADRERDVFRATNGKCKVWGSDPRFIKAKYTIVDRKTGKETEKTSLLLASGFWGMARHFQYFFELTAAYSWCFLANPLENGVLVMLYAVFLTCLLVDRAKRDTEKCKLKYGKYYEEYCSLVPYKIVPGCW